MRASYYVMSDLERQLTQLYEKKKTRRALYRKELRQLSEGNLVIRQQENGRFYFYEKRDGQERGITKKKVHASWLARKMFLEKCLDAAELECRVLSGALKQLEQLIYQTKSGIMVRSKSERMIADFLTEHGIPFRYEAKLVIHGRTYYPDFTILCEDGTLLLWEHFGLMEQDEYFKHACEKIKAYRKKGYMQHTNLICTWEEDLLQAEQLEEILIRFGVGILSGIDIDQGAAA